jgi:hypothetical protein
MEILILWTLIAYGFTTIVVWGSIFENVRQWIKSKSNFFGSLISCVLCTSTWVGFILSIMTGGLTSDLWDSWWIINVFLDGMYTAGSVWALNSIVEYFEENRPNTDEKIGG